MVNFSQIILLFQTDQTQKRNFHFFFFFFFLNIWVFTGQKSSILILLSDFQAKSTKKLEEILKKKVKVGFLCLVGLSEHYDLRKSDLCP